MVKVKDLKQQKGVPGVHPFLYCETCGAECSANAADYFMAQPETIFKCCGRNMRLVTKHVEYRNAT